MADACVLYGGRIKRRTLFSLNTTVIHSKWSKIAWMLGWECFTISDNITENNLGNFLCVSDNISVDCCVSWRAVNGQKNSL